MPSCPVWRWGLQGLMGVMPVMLPGPLPWADPGTFCSSYLASRERKGKEWMDPVWPPPTLDSAGCFPLGSRKHILPAWKYTSSESPLGKGRQAC